MVCEVCNGTGELKDAVQAWDVLGAPVPRCPHCVPLSKVLSGTHEMIAARDGSNPQLRERGSTSAEPVSENVAESIRSHPCVVEYVAGLRHYAVRWFLKRGRQ